MQCVVLIIIYSYHKKSPSNVNTFIVDQFGKKLYLDKFGEMSEIFYLS